MTTPWKQHLNEWRGCTACDLHKTRKHMVFARGQVPCDVLFIGIGPGDSEDVLGKPFVGPAGQLLDSPNPERPGIVQQALSRWQVPGTAGPGYNAIRTCFTNLVCCVPKDERGAKAHDPDEVHILACRPRLEQFLEIARPALIVCVGVLARDYVMDRDAFGRPFKYSVKLPEPPVRTPHIIDITHPSAILQANVVQRDILFNRAVIRLQNAVEDLIEQGVIDV